jgi:hypothetical protein
MRRIRRPAVPHAVHQLLAKPAGHAFEFRRCLEAVAPANLVFISR